MAMNPFDLMKQMGALQNQMQQLQSKLGTITATGEAGAGMVSVTVNGLFAVQSVHIDPSLTGAEQVHTLEVLVAAAFSDATKRVQEKIKAEGMGMLGGLGA